MLTSETKRKIDNLRDTLVGKIPVPSQQVELITLGLIYKFMSDIDEQNLELGAKDSFFNGKYKQYAWSRIIDRSLSGQERTVLFAEGLEQMANNPNLPQLFRDIFKGAYLPFKDPVVLDHYLKGINELAYTHSEELGNAFEYLLSVMGAQGDAGQFRTPRHIIDFLVKAVDPKKEDIILDPACGTAGFLISAYKHILEENTKSGGKPGSALGTTERKKLADNFNGYDISHDMVRLSLANMYLHNLPEPNIHEYDTLSDDTRWNETFDCILANPPFMSPRGGIRPHNRFSVQSTRSEVLFVDYIAEHLNPNGKAGIIVPAGILFNNGNTYKQLRKMLIEENYLWSVVSLPSGVFNPYSPVKTSILLFDKTLASKTKNVVFLEIGKDGFELGSQRTPLCDSENPAWCNEYSDINGALDFLKKCKETICEGDEKKLSDLTVNEELLAHVVDKRSIREDGDYNLSVNRYLTNPTEDLRKTIQQLQEQLQEPVEKINEALSPMVERLQVLQKQLQPYQKQLQGIADAFESSNIPQLTKYLEQLDEKINTWPYVELGEVLDYEQPTRYIVSSTKYDDAYETPVLTAGKTFILGYTNENEGVFTEPLPVIIFDDFTTATKLVDFPFKVKSSAMKILKVKPEVADIRYVFHAMQYINFDASEHKRYWISQYSKIKIPLPPIEVQNKIVQDIEIEKDKIRAAETEIEQYEKNIKEKTSEIWGH